MAGVTTTEITHPSVKKVSFAFSTAADGSASGTTTSAYAGQVGRAVITPTGVKATSWECTVKDADGIDVLLGNGAGLTSATIVTAVNAGWVAGSKLTLDIVSALTAATGVVDLYIR